MLVNRWNKILGNMNGKMYKKWPPVPTNQTCIERLDFPGPSTWEKNAQVPAHDLGVISCRDLPLIFAAFGTRPGGLVLEKLHGFSLPKYAAEYGWILLDHRFTFLGKPPGAAKNGLVWCGLGLRVAETLQVNGEWACSLFWSIHPKMFATCNVQWKSFAHRHLPQVCLHGLRHSLRMSNGYSDRFFWYMFVGYKYKWYQYTFGTMIM